MQFCDLESFIGKLSSIDALKDEEDLWQDVLDLPSDLKTNFTSSRSTEKDIDDYLSPLLKQFILKNTSTGNLCLLVKLCINKCDRLKHVSITELSEESPPVANLLLIMRLICRHFLEKMPFEALQRHLTMTSLNIDDGDEENRNTVNNSKKKVTSLPALRIEAGLDAKLCRSLLSIICNIPLSNGTINLHDEAITALIVLMSSRMYDERVAEENSFYSNIILKTNQSDANLLTKRLLQNYLCPITNEDEASNKLNYSASEMASKFFSSFIPFYDSETTSTKFTCSKNFCDKSLLLVEILTNHCTQSINMSSYEAGSEGVLSNTFREAISSFVDFSLNIGSQGVGIDVSHASFSISYEFLYRKLCKNLEEDQVTLMLYMLLHKNSSFLNYVLSRSDIDRMLLPLLKVLYDSKNTSSHHLYMILIILLILSEDTILNNVISETMLPQVSWFSEKLLTDFSLASLMVLVLLRTIQVNITQMKDKYLHTNCLATLANMSNHFQNLNQYAAQRLVSLTTLLTKKQAKLNMKLSRVLNDEVAENSVRTELAVIEEILRLLLEIINNTLTKQLPHNSSLVHCLIYDKQLFEVLRSNHNFQDVVYNLDIVINFFLARLDQSKDDTLSLSNCENVLEFIKENSKVFPLSHLHKFPELKFRYCEEEAPEDFFIPYIWSIAYRNSGIYWNIDFLTLFKLILD